MRILLGIAHYFAGEANPRHASTDAARRDQRAQAVAQVILAYRGLFSPPVTIDIASKSFQRNTGGGDQLDIALVTVPGCGLLDDAFCERMRVTRIECRPADPRMLGFHVHELFAKLATEYDLFCFSEDDLRPSDPALFAKIADFARRHGSHRVLLPNRYEWNPAGPAIKTYIDGDLRAGLVDPLIALNPDVEVLEEPLFGRTLTLRRARNPHAGFFAITAAQLGHWLRQPHWLDRDTSFVSPLESAATLGLVKTFAVYKPWGPAAAHLELQHLDTRFSGLRLPWASAGLAALVPGAD